MRFCLFLLGLCLTAVAFGDDPRLYSVNPLVAQRGVEYEGFFSGDRLLDFESVFLYDDENIDNGLTVVEAKPRLINDGDKKDADGNPLKKPDPKRIDVKIAVPADCPLGKHRLRLATRTGQTEMRNVLVVDVPVVREDEKTNKSFEQPQPIDMNVAVVGRITSEDVDYYQVRLKEGQRLTAEVHGTRLGNSSGDRYFDPYVAVLDEDRFEVASCDDHPLTGNDPFVSFVAQKAGPYVVAVRHSAYNGDNQSHYVMHIGEMPRPVAVQPPGGRPGETVEATFLLANATAEEPEYVTQSITLPTEEQLDAATHPFGVWLTTDGGVAPSAMPMQVSAMPSVAEAEPNDHEQKEPQAVDFKTGRIAVHGVIDKAGDEDNVLVPLKKNQTVRIQPIASAIGSPLDAVINVYQVTPKFKHEKGADDNGRDFDGTLDFTAPEDGTYAVRIRDHRDRFGPDYVYRLEIGPRPKELVVEPIEFARYVQHKLTVPRGGGVGVNLAVTRRFFGGDVEFSSSDLPEGVRVEVPKNWTGQGRMPMVLYAAPDAPLAATYARIDAVHQSRDKDGNPKGEPVAAPIEQKILMVRWRNNDRVTEEPLTRLPVVVVEEAPFTVTLERPDVPLVPGSYLPLTVTVDRDRTTKTTRTETKGGVTVEVVEEKTTTYDGEIRVVVLQNPPGCSSSQSAKIPKGQNSTTINLTANDKARLGTYDLAVRAYSGARETASAFVPVEVAAKSIDLEWQQAAAEQGQTTSVLAKLTHEGDWTGQAEATLAGLPPHATAEPVMITPEMEEVVWTVTVGEKTPPGTHKSLHALVKVPHGELPEKPPTELVQVSTTGPGTSEPAVENEADASKDKEPADSKDEKKAEEKGDPKPDAEKPDAPAEPAPPAKPFDPRPTVLHQLKGGVLRVDKPLPVKKAPPKADAKKDAEKDAKKAEKAKAPAKPKPLSRLEQLRKAKLDAK